MSIDELILTREEVPIHAKFENIFACEYFAVPVPQKVVQHYKGINTYIYAKNAIIESINNTFHEAIIYECDKRLDYEKTLIEYSKKLWRKDSLDEYMEVPDKVESIDELKLMILKHYNFLKGENELLETKKSDALYLCIKINYTSCLKNDLEHFKKMKAGFLELAQKEKNQDNIDYIINISCFHEKGLACFDLPGNGIGIYPSGEFCRAHNFNMTEGKFDKIMGRNPTAYFPHNVDSFYNAILLREFALNYINSLAKNM
jgi:hypothetical protein